MQADLFDTEPPEPQKASREPAPVKPPVRRPSPCPYCGARILRAIADQGHPMNVEGAPRGPYVVDGVSALERPLLRLVNGAGEVLRCGGQVLRRARPDEPRYQSHFATCPKAATWNPRGACDPLQRAWLAERADE